MCDILLILCVLTCNSSVVFSKSRDDKIDRSYDCETCNLSVFDKSVSDTNTVIAATWIFVFPHRLNLKYDMCVSMCIEVAGACVAST